MKLLDCGYDRLKSRTGTHRLTAWPSLLRVGTGGFRHIDCLYMALGNSNYCLRSTTIWLLKSDWSWRSYSNFSSMEKLDGDWTVLVRMCHALGPSAWPRDKNIAVNRSHLHCGKWKGASACSFVCHMAATLRTNNRFWKDEEMQKWGMVASYVLQSIVEWDGLT